MPKTPDRAPGPSDEEATIYEATGVATQAGEVRFTGTRFSMHDGATEFDPATGSGLSEAQHEDLDTLVHALAENAFVEVVRSGGRVTDVIAWTDGTKTTKIRETNITRTGGLVSQVVSKQYNGAGSLVQTLTQTITRSGGQVASISVAET